MVHAKLNEFEWNAEYAVVDCGVLFRLVFGVHEEKIEASLDRNPITIRDISSLFFSSSVEPTHRWAMNERENQFYQHQKRERNFNFFLLACWLAER